MQVKTIMSYHLTLVRLAIIKKLHTINAVDGVEKREPSYIVGGKGLIQPLWIVVWRFLKKLKIELLYDAEIHYWAYTQRKP